MHGWVPGRTRVLTSNERQQLWLLKEPGIPQILLLTQEVFGATWSWKRPFVAEAMGHHVESATQGRKPANFEIGLTGETSNFWWSSSDGGVAIMSLASPLFGWRQRTTDIAIQDTKSHDLADYSSGWKALFVTTGLGDVQGRRLGKEE